jgi:hypothetical protein
VEKQVMAPLRPGDFPIGSIESRVAMRQSLENPNTRRLEIEIISNVRLLEEDESRPARGSWNEFGDGIVLRFVSSGDSGDKERIL